MTGSGNAGGRLALWAALGVCIAAIFWTADGVAPWDGDRSNAWHQYEYLTEGFLRGHTYLSVEPAPELLKLKDPYDPAANAPYRLWDTSLYRGRYYLYQGPTPAVALMLPWRIATGRMLPQRLAVATFAALGLAALGLLLWEVRGRHFPGISAWAVGAILLVVFHATWLPVTLRRSALWELPVVAAAACLWWSLYFLWKFHDSGGRVRWGCAAGIALALLMGSRAAAVLGAGVIALLLFIPTGRLVHRWRGPVLAAAIAAAAGLALLAYNRARFGHWLDFGLTYALFGEDYRSVKYSSLRLIPYNFWVYLFASPRPGPYFPFLHPFWSDDNPAGFIGYEEMYGVAFMMPVHIAAFAAFGWAWTNRAAAGMRAVTVTLAGALCATVLAGAVLFAWAWACSRFITELMAGWTVATGIGLMVLFNPGAARAGRITRLFAVAAACWTIICVWLASADFRGFMRETNPRAYAAFAHALDYPSFWWARAHNIGYGPVDVEIRLPSSTKATQTVLMASGRPQNMNQLTLERSAAGDRFLFSENEHRVLESPALPEAQGRLYVRVFAPWLYPPRESPFWDGVAPAQRADLQRRFEVSWGAGEASTYSTRAADAVDFAPAVLGPADPGTGSPWVDSLKPVLIYPQETGVTDAAASRAP
jgi:hypothetical protein